MKKKQFKASLESVCIFFFDTLVEYLVHFFPEFFSDQLSVVGNIILICVILFFR